MSRIQPETLAANEASQETEREFEKAYPMFSSVTHLAREIIKPYHKLGKKRRSFLSARIKTVFQEQTFQKYLKSMGLCLSKIEVKPIDEQQEMRTSFDDDDDDNEEMLPFEEEQEKKEKKLMNFQLVINSQHSTGKLDYKGQPNVNAALFVKDKHSMADRTYCGLRSICHVNVPNINQIKRRRLELDSILPVYENEMGVHFSMRDKLKARLESFFDSKYGISSNLDEANFNDFIIHVKLSADGMTLFL